MQKLGKFTANIFSEHGNKQIKYKLLLRGGYQHSKINQLNKSMNTHNLRMLTLIQMVKWSNGLNTNGILNNLSTKTWTNASKVVR